jgi:hypothetical protein
MLKTETVAPIPSASDRVVAELAEGVANVLQESVHQTLRNGDRAQAMEEQLSAQSHLEDRKSSSNAPYASAYRYAVE